MDLFTYLISEMDSEYMTIKYSDKSSSKPVNSSVEIIESNSDESNEMTGNNF